VAVPGPVVVAPGLPAPPPVYYAPSLPYNYFVYRQAYYLYHHGRWFRARRYHGPWTAVTLPQVPRPILAVPAQYYRHRPARWAPQGPPPWGQERHRARGRGRQHGWGQAQQGGHHDHGHGKERG
jgi:hypothetical protein